MNSFDKKFKKKKNTFWNYNQIIYINYSDIIFYALIIMKNHFWQLNLVFCGFQFFFTFFFRFFQFFVSRQFWFSDETIGLQRSCFWGGCGQEFFKVFCVLWNFSGMLVFRFYVFIILICWFFVILACLLFLRLETDLIESINYQFHKLLRSIEQKTETLENLQQTQFSFTQIFQL
ncbi:hypothetical protein pb186bvf_002461 [Paramecium bursaria]